MTVDQFCLKWNNYQISLTSAFKHLLEEEDFVDVTLSAEGQSLKAHKVVLSACSQYFKELLKGINPWQHPVLVLREVPFIDLQNIIEFVYLGEVNVEQDRLQSFLKTAELLRIKGLTDGLNDRKESDEGVFGHLNNKTRKFSQSDIVEKPAQVVPAKPLQTAMGKTKRPLSALSDEIIRHTSSPNKSDFSPEKRTKHEDIFIPQTIVNTNKLDIYEDPESDDEGINDDSTEIGYDGEHIIVAGDPVTNADFDNHNDPQEDDYEGELVIGLDDKEVLGPLHKRCPHCQMIMLKKNLSRHIRDQHSSDRPRSNCPICQKSYKTPDWLKDHIRRGHGYTKEATDELIIQLNLKPMSTPKKMNSPCPPTVVAICSTPQIPALTC